MRHVRTMVIGALLAAGTALGADDPWIVPGQIGADLIKELTDSPRSYSLNGGKTPWDGANGPERVEPAADKEEKDVVAAARALVAKGDADGAAKAIDAVIAKDAANWDAWLVRAETLHAKGSDADAVQPLRISLIGNRRCPAAWKLADDVAKALSKKVARPKFDVRGWVRELPKDEVEVGSVFLKDSDMPWSYYAAARAVYRWEGGFKRDFPSAKTYAFTFKEQMFAMSVLVAESESQGRSGEKNPADLTALLAERKAGTLTEFTFFAVWPEALTATPEPGMDELRPRLEKYFDEKILVKP